MSDITRLRKAVVDRILEGPGVATTQHRRAAFANADVPAAARALIDKVARNASQITDADVAAVKQAGVSEDAIFELVVSAAVGQASRQLDAALGALEEA